MPLGGAGPDKPYLAAAIAVALMLSGCISGPADHPDDTKSPPDGPFDNDTGQPLDRPSTEAGIAPPTHVPLSFSGCKSWSAYVAWPGETIDPAVPNGWEAGPTVLDGVLTFMVQCNRIGLGLVEATDTWVAFNGHTHFQQPDSCQDWPQVDFLVDNIWISHDELAAAWQASFGIEPFTTQIALEQETVASTRLDSISWVGTTGQNQIDFTYYSGATYEWESQLVLAWASNPGVTAIALSIVDELPDPGNEPVRGSTSSPEVSARHGLTTWIGFPTVSFDTQLEVEEFHSETTACVL